MIDPLSFGLGLIVGIAFLVAVAYVYAIKCDDEED